MVCGPFRSILVFCAAMADLFMGGHLAFTVDFQTSGSSIHVRIPRSDPFCSTTQ
jgi:hypothetical protein